MSGCEPGETGRVSAAHMSADAGPPVVNGCTLTQGYWKNHEEWPVGGLMIGLRWYTAGTLDDLLETEPRGDASMILAHQLIAALLNRANGATPIAAINDALNWMTLNDPGRPLAYGIAARTTAGQQAVALSRLLDVYNNGRTEGGPGHCSSPPPPGDCVDTAYKTGDYSENPCEEPPPPCPETTEKTGTYSEDPCANDPL